MTFWDFLALVVAVILVALGASVAIDRRLDSPGRVGFATFAFGIAALLVCVALA